MSDTLKLGQVIEPGREAYRDAIHVAVAPVVAGEELQAGDWIEVVGGAAYTSASPVGIVDPFLTVAVRPGERLWLWLIPGSITSLRHVWTHPAFQHKPPKVVSDE